MKDTVPDFTQMARLVQSLDISRYDDAFLMQSLKRRRDLLQMQDLSSYLSFLMQNEAERRAFLQSLENNYTEFFRSGLIFAHLEHWILPNLIEQLPANRELRIWSAGCSSGQEPYSLAILLENLAEKRRTTFRYRIFATDTSVLSLEAARKGEYGEDAVQALRLKDISTYFSRSNGRYVVSNQLRKHVSFSVYDLFDSSSAIPPESIFGDFNLVICSNVLIYYNDSAQQLIINKLFHSIVENGYLITGEAERHSASRKTGLRTVSLPNPIFRKAFEVHNEAEQS